MTPSRAGDALGLHFPQSIEANPGGGRGGLRLRVTTDLPEGGSSFPGKLQRFRSSVHWLSFLKVPSPRGFACGQRRDPLCPPVLPGPPEGQRLFLTFPLIFFLWCHRKAPSPHPRKLHFCNSPNSWDSRPQRGQTGWEDTARHPGDRASPPARAPRAGGWAPPTPAPGGSRAEVAPPGAPVSISQRDGANLRPTSAGGGVRRPARPPGPGTPAPRTPRPLPGAPRAAARPGPPARPPPPAPRSAGFGSRPQARRGTYSARPGRRRRRPQPCCAGEGGRGRRREGADGRRGGLAARGAEGPGAASGRPARAALRPRGPPATAAAARVLLAARLSLAGPREVATWALPQPRASAEPPPPVGRVRVRPARAAALRLRGSAPRSPNSRRFYI